MNQQLRFHLGRASAAVAVVVFLVGADGDIGVRARQVAIHPAQPPTQRAAETKVADLAFLACRARHGVAAYVWCDRNRPSDGPASVATPLD